MDFNILFLGITIIKISVIIVIIAFIINKIKIK